MGIVEFVCWAFAVGMFGCWLLILSDKWGIREYAQVHAPCDFIYKLLTCNFCTSWWLNVAICITLLLVTGKWEMLITPAVSTIITLRSYEGNF